MKLKAAISLFLVLALVFAFGCAAKVDVSEVRSYADSMSENLLTAINGKNYEMFSRDFDSAMENAVSKSKFSTLLAQINGKIGAYIPNSKEFERAYKSGKFMNVVYKAKFTNETSSVTVRIVFDEVNGKHKISGLWFDSPKLKQE